MYISVLPHMINNKYEGKNIKNHKQDESLSKSYFYVYNHTKDFYIGIFNEILLSKEDFYIKIIIKKFRKLYN